MCRVRRELSPIQTEAVKILNARGTLSDADGFTIRTARSLERRGLLKLTVWKAREGGYGWSGEKR